MSVSVYDTKQYDGEVPVMLELWRMRSFSFIKIETVLTFKLGTHAKTELLEIETVFDI